MIDASRKTVHGDYTLPEALEDDIEVIQLNAEHANIVNSGRQSGERLAKFIVGQTFHFSAAVSWAARKYSARVAHRFTHFESTVQ